ncbi:MAG TPA: glycosyltransferase family 39 protein [Blattabacteriaceae bacterium]|nr:glycosyltransferase family 39 protein [Blattabacteriaceae bacterium]
MKELAYQQDQAAVAVLARQQPSPRRHYEIVLVIVAAIVFFGCIISPPGLMDDVDAVHGQIARNMVQSGDWVIAHLDGVPYMEKAPLPYWLIAICYLLMGVHDWVARIPTAIAAVLLCFVTARYGAWAFGRRAGFYAGLVLATSIGLFLFTRILIPDVMLTLTITICFMAFQRAMNEDGEEPRSRRWPALIGIALGLGVLLKGLLALLVPVGGVLVYLAITRQLFSREIWRRLRPLSTVLIFLLIAAPWHVLATLRMPPYFNFSMHSGPGEYHGFFWFYFFNEHLLRFLNLRYPRDYNTVPRLAFWLLNLVWLFPWSAYLPAAAKLNYKPVDRAGRTRLLALCWAGFLMLFFTFSTTQEYYSMPIYPALALLLGCAMDDDEGKFITFGSRTIALLSTVAVAVIGAVLFAVRHVPAAGDISSALQQHPESYTLSLGHMGDLTLQSFAYLRAPLMVAGIAFLAGAAGGWLRGRRAFIALAAMMVLFLHASRMALVVFDPYLSSRPIAEALLRAPSGQLIVDGAYYPFSSIMFYSNKGALLLNGRVNNLEYGSYAPNSPSVFINDAAFIRLWSGTIRYYLVTDSSGLARLSALAGSARFHQVAESGGKFLFTNGLSGETADGSKMENKPALW